MTNPAVVDIPDEARVSIGRQAVETLLALTLVVPIMVLCNARLLAFIVVLVQNAVSLLVMLAMRRHAPSQRKWQRLQQVLFGASFAVVALMFFPADQPLLQGIRPLSTLLHRLGY